MHRSGGRGIVRKRRRENGQQVYVRRERPSLPAVVVALAVSMLMVCFAVGGPLAERRAEGVFALPDVTRETGLAGIQTHMVALYSCNSQEEARMMASGHTSRGAAGYVFENGGKWLVLGAAYEEKRDAERIARRLAEEEGIQAQVVPVTAEKIDMRITAPDVMIGAVADADALLCEQINQLGEMALQLDRVDIPAGTVCTLCAVQATRSGACMQVLEAIPGHEENLLVGGLIARLDGLNRLLSAIADSRGKDRMVLSGMLRCAQIDTIVGKAELHERILSGGT